jgi:hypothetical protein
MGPGRLFTGASALGFDLEVKVPPDPLSRHLIYLALNLGQ